MENEKKYLNNIFNFENTLLQEIKIDIEINDKAINIDIFQAKLLSMILKLNNTKTLIEIGTHFGYSALCFKSNIPDLKIITIEKDIKRAQKAAENFKKSSYSDISLKIGDAVDVLNTLRNDAPYDAIFIDANKSAYHLYLDWADEHVKRGGIIIVDNNFLNGEIFSKNRVSKNNIDKMLEFNKRIADQNKYESVIFPYRDGFSITIKK